MNRLTWALILIACQASAAEEAVDRMAGWVSFADYQPAFTNEYTTIPAEIRAKVDQHLRDRVGVEFARRLSFFRAQIVDDQEIVRHHPALMSGDMPLVMAGGSDSDGKYMAWVNEGLKKQHLKIHAYDFHFVLNWPEKGIRSYVASVRLDKTGRILWALDLPEIRKHPSKAKIISLEAAKKIAKENGFDLAGATLEFEYSPDTGFFVWQFTRTIEQGKVSSKHKRIIIGAENGTVLKEYSFNSYSA